MEKQIVMTGFTDPMMGLSYESEPILGAQTPLWSRILPSTGVWESEASHAI